MLKNIKSIPLTIVIIFFSLLFALTLLLYVITQISITSSNQTSNPGETICFKGFYPFPQLYKIETLFQYEKTIKSPIDIFNKYEIFSNEICITPKVLLDESTDYHIKASYFLFYKEIMIQTLDYPTVQAQQFTNTINTNDTLTYETTYPIPQLTYAIILDNQTIPCVQASTTISCDTSQLNIKEGQSYEIQLAQLYNNQILKIVKTDSLQILTSVMVKDTSLKDNEIIQSLSVPEISIILNKEIDDTYQVQIQDENKHLIPIETKLQENILRIVPQTQLVQGTRYTLTLNNLHGIDTSRNLIPYVLHFSIDDGPAIKSTNLGSGFSTNSNLILTFNQDIDNKQDIKKFVKLNSATNYTYSVYKNTITINPNNSLDFCKTFQVTINKGIKSTTSLVSTHSYTYSPKTSCRRVYTLGTSVQGRSIYAYYFGNGSQKIVFFASIHGSESNTKATLNYWINELENNTSKIPSDKTIIVIPSINPDGIANSTRFNANGVDLNRNFDTANWTSGTYLQDNYYPNGGGSMPFSEPESVIIRNLILREHPYLTLTYHAAAGYVVPSNTVLGTTLGQKYAQMTGYRYIAPGTSGAFAYAITGTFEEWAEEHGYNALVIELSSAYSSQFSQNKNAMWEMVNY